MTYPKDVWRQLKAKDCKDIMRALRAAGYQEDVTSGATRGFINAVGHRLIIRYHSKGGYQRKLLKALLDELGWSVSELAQYGLIKKPKGKKRP